MHEPIGHEKVRIALEKELPSVSLLLGPKSVGKRTMAEYVARYHGILPVDLRQINNMSADEARDLKLFALKAPFGKLKLVIARLDGATEIAMNALLKLLEEPPAKLRFILICSTSTFATIMSRSHIFRMGLLTYDELQEVLTERIGMEPGYAQRVAALGRGQVEVALQMDINDVARASVLSLLKAIVERDRELFDKAIASWDHLTEEKASREEKERAREEARNLLFCWIREAITGSWCVFSESETFSLSQDRERLRKMRIALYKLPATRAKLSVRVALEPFLIK